MISTDQIYFPTLGLATALVSKTDALTTVSMTQINMKFKGFLTDLFITSHVAIFRTSFFFNNRII